MPLKVGDHVYYCGEKCYVYSVAPDGSLGLERCDDGISWDCVSPKGCTLCAEDAPQNQPRK